MAKICDFDELAFLRWVKERPESIQQMCKDFPPNRLYRLSTTDHRCRIYSYSEDGTMTVNVTGEYNIVMFSRAVFGIKPEELTECDLPGKDEIVGEALNQEEATEFIRVNKL